MGVSIATFSSRLLFVSSGEESVYAKAINAVGALGMTQCRLAIRGMKTLGRLWMRVDGLVTPRPVLAVSTSHMHVMRSPQPWVRDEDLDIANPYKPCVCPLRNNTVWPTKSSRC